MASRVAVEGPGYLHVQRAGACPYFVRVRIVGDRIVGELLLYALGRRYDCVRLFTFRVLCVGVVRLDGVVIVRPLTYVRKDCTCGGNWRSFLANSVFPLP